MILETGVLRTPVFGFEFGGSFAITNPEPVILKDEEYKEMIEALKKELNL